MRTRNELPALFRERGYAVAAEVGVLRGEFSHVILSGWDGTLYMIDAWKHLPGYIDISNGSDGQHESNYRLAAGVANAHGQRARIVRKLSIEASAGFADGSLDVVYLDADHSKAAVLADLQAWVPKVRRGGLICGHDYLDGVRPEGHFGVKSAVGEFFGREPDVVTQESWPSWLINL